MKPIQNEQKQAEALAEIEKEENKFVDELALTLAAIARQIYAAENSEAKEPKQS